MLNSTPNDKEFEKELAILCNFQSPYIVYFFGACVSPKFCLVTEFMGLGSLADYMQVLTCLDGLFADM